MTCQPYYLIECQHYAVLSARIEPLGAGATSEPKSSCSLPFPTVPVSMEVDDDVEWGKTRHKGQPTGGVVRSGHSTRPASVTVVQRAGKLRKKKVRAALTRDCQ